MTTVTKIAQDKIQRPEIVLGYWLFDVIPEQHRLWHYYLLSLFTLADDPKLPPATIYQEGATHEIMLTALDPAYPPDAEDLHTIKFLTPPNYAYQFKAQSDEDAVQIAERIVPLFQSGACLFETQGMYQGKEMNDMRIQHIVDSFYATPNPWKLVRNVASFPPAYRYLWAKFAREHEKVIRVMPDPDNNSLDVIVDTTDQGMADEIISAIQKRFEQEFIPE